MEDEVVQEKGRYNFELILSEENIPIHCKINEEFGIYLVDADEEESRKDSSRVSKLRKILKNPENYNGKIIAVWYQKDGEDFSPPKIESLSAKELAFMSPYFLVLLQR